MTKEKKDAPKKKEKKKSSVKLTALLIIGSLAMIVFLQMTYVLFVVGMLPSIVAFYVDRTPSRQIFHTVMPCNLSGVLPFVVELAMIADNRGTAMQMMLSDLTVLLIMYASAAFGWIMVYAAPHMAGLAIDGLNQRQISKIRRSQSQLQEEWGAEVARVTGD